MRFDGRGPTTGETTELTDENNTRPDDMAAISEEQDDTGDSDGHVSAGSAAEEAKMCELVAVHCMGPNLLGNRTSLTHLCFHFHNISEFKTHSLQASTAGSPDGGAEPVRIWRAIGGILIHCKAWDIRNCTCHLGPDNFQPCRCVSKLLSKTRLVKGPLVFPWHAEMPCCEQSALKGYRMANATI